MTTVMAHWMCDFIPRVLPNHLSIIESADVGASYRGRNFRGPYTVIFSGRIEKDGKKWLHLSVARPDKLPEWELLKEMKSLFIGRRRQAIQVLPSDERYVNIHPYCLHLFCCVDDADPVPDFVVHGML